MKVVTQVQIARAGMELDPKGPDRGQVLQLAKGAYRSAVMERGIVVRCKCEAPHPDARAGMLCLFGRMGCWLQ